MALLKRKVDSVLAEWKARPDHKPLILTAPTNEFVEAVRYKKISRP